MGEVLEWRVLCISGVFASKTASLFQTTKKGAQKAQWGTKGYLAQLGSLSSSNKATLGPVLKAIAEKPAPSKTLILFNWVAEMSRLLKKGGRVPPDTAAKIALGNAALKALKQSVTIVQPKASNKTSQPGRATSQVQFTQLAFVDNVLIGSGYSDTLEPIWPPQLWYDGSLQIFDFPTGSATSVFQVRCNAPQRMSLHERPHIGTDSVLFLS